MSDRGTISESLIVDALRAEASRRMPSAVLLIGMQACSTVRAANELVGADRVVLLHLDRAAGAVGCDLGNHELYLGEESGLGGRRGLSGARTNEGLDSTQRERDAAGQSALQGGPDVAGRDGSAASFAVVGLNVEAARSYRLLRQVVNQMAEYVDAAGVVLVAGPRKGGAEVAARTLCERFERVELVTYRKGQRIFRASRPRLVSDVDRSRGGEGRSHQAAPEIVTVTLRGRPMRLLQDDRVFAKGRLDPATRMLAEVFEIPPGFVVLDLGCGSGVLGILAALLEPSSRVTLVDSDPLAVEVSRRNAVLNGVSNVVVYLSDVLSDLPDADRGRSPAFDVVLMNPPFHRGRLHDVSIAERFMTDASRALRPGGHLYVVCSRFLRYEPLLERLAGTVREVAGDRRFKVLLAGPR
jgi:16S rRNA (guanine1207-N2)-methyltransferase